MNLKIKIFFFGFLLLPLFILIPRPASASLWVCGGSGAADSTLQKPVRKAGETAQEFQKRLDDYNKAALDNSSECTLSDVFRAIAKLTNFLLTYAGLIAVFRIVFVSLQLAQSGDNEHSVAEAKKKFFNIGYGFVIIMIAYILINTIYTVFHVDTAFTFPFNPFK